MQQYKKIDASEGVDVNKTSASKECQHCQYWFFKDVGFKFEDHVWINKIDPYSWFQRYFRDWLGRRLKVDKRQINRWKKIVSRFRGKIVQIIKDAGSKFDDYSVSPQIRQILLHWAYELTEEGFF